MNKEEVSSLITKYRDAELGVIFEYSTDTVADTLRLYEEIRVLREKNGQKLLKEEVEGIKECEEMSQEDE